MLKLFSALLLVSVPALATDYSIWCDNRGASDNVTYTFNFTLRHDPAAGTCLAKADSGDYKNQFEQEVDCRIKQAFPNDKDVFTIELDVTSTKKTYGEDQNAPDFLRIQYQLSSGWGYGSAHTIGKRLLSMTCLPGPDRHPFPAP